jgi:hypothetical protein
MENVKNKARRNIDLLEKADEIALSHLSNKILKPRKFNMYIYIYFFIFIIVINLTY